MSIKLWEYEDCYEKNTVLGVLILSAMFIFPLCGVKTVGGKSTAAAAVRLFNVKTDNREKNDTFRVCDMQTDTVSVMTADEYIFGGACRRNARAL